MRKLILGSALAATVSATAAHAAVTVTAGSGADFATFNSATVGSHSGSSVTDEGSVSWSTGPSSFATNTSLANAYLAPKGDSSMYIFATTGSDATVTFSHDIYGFSIYWGSPDGDNLLTLYNGDTVVGVVAGADLAALTGYGSGDNDGSLWVRVSSDLAFNRFVASTASPAFEFDLAAPEPATWAMMGLGFAALGYAAFRRSKKPRGAAIA